MASTLLVLGLVAAMVRLQGAEPPVAVVEQPERALALIVGRTMDVQTALGVASAWEQRLYAAAFTDTAGEIGLAIAWYQELADYSLVPGVDLRLAVLLGEAGRSEPLGDLLARWPARGDPLAAWAPVLALAYLDGDRPEPGDVEATLAALGPGWFADTLARRLATRLDQPALEDAARRATEARARPLLSRLRALAALDLGLLVLGGLAAPGLWRQLRASRPVVADAPLPPPWSLGAGLTALVRGAALSALLLLVVFFGGDWLVDQPLVSGVLDQPLTYVPVLLVVGRMLLTPAGLGPLAAFGLRPRPDGWRPLARATLVLIAAGALIDLGLGLLSVRLGLASHWAEWFDADLAWGPPARVAVTVLGAAVFAPVFEELIFRGMLYGSLRARLTWPAAAAGSALVFGLAHGYGLVGFLSVFLSGLIWAWSYERTGSLLPAMAAHAANNLAVAVALTALLR